MRMSMRQQEYVSLTVTAVCDLMNDSLRSLGRPDGVLDRSETIRALQLGLDEIELLWSEVSNRPDELARSSNSFAEFFDFAPDAYLITRGDGTICLANRMAAELMETPSVELCGQRLDAFVRQEDRGAVAQMLGSPGKEQGAAWQAWSGGLHFRDGSDLEVEFKMRGFHAAYGGARLCYWLLRSGR
jgi:PAS domain-containing protein